MPDEKIVLDHQKLRLIISEHKKNGRTVVFTNGCFDLLHVGHIRCLKGAKEEGDRLVVGVNSDASMMALGKKGRPLMPENERLEILSSIVYVDYLTVFSDSTVDNILKTLEPNVFAKGTDYTVEDVPERDTALAIRARIAIVGDPKDHSSSGYFTKISKNFREVKD